MKKITQWLLVISLVWGTMVFTACGDDSGSSAESFDATEELSSEKFIHDEWMDRSVKPGDSFWEYALGKWLKKHSKSDEGFAAKEEENLNEKVYAGLSSYKFSVAGHVLKLIMGTAPSAEKEVAVLKEVISLLKNGDDITMEDVIYNAGQLADLRFCPIFGHEVLNVNGTLRNTLTTGVSAIPSDALELINEEGVKQVVAQTFVTWGVDVSTPKMTSIIESVAEIERKMDELQRKWTDPLPASVRKKRIVKNVSPLLASNLPSIRSSKLSYGGKNLESAFKKAFHVDNKTYYLPEIEQVFDMLDKYDVKTWQAYLNFYVFYKLGRVMFATGNEPEEIYENMNSMSPSIFAEYHTSILCKDADVDGAVQMLEEMRSLMAERINNLDWLSASTKQKALDKLQAMTLNVCGPKKLFNTSFKMTGKTPVEDFVQYGRQVDEYMRTTLVGSSTKDHGWEVLLTSAIGVSLDVTNAFYTALLNQLFILPAFIHGEYFPTDKDDVMRYATLSIFGHEMTHGFDGNGATYDKKGNKTEWWTSEDKKKFEERKLQMIELYSDLDVLPGLKTDGEKTLNENIADYGGINLAWQMWNNKLEADGLTGEDLRHQQREFMLAIAYLWQIDADEEMLTLYRDIDEHAANHVRVNGMMRLMDDWYTLFDVQPDDKLYVKPEDRVKIW